MLLVVCAMLLGACGRPPSERPREGAPVIVDGPSVRKGDQAASNPAPPPTLSSGTPPSPEASPGEQATGGEPTGSPSPSPSPSPPSAPTHVIVATDGAGANLRTGPSTTAPVIATLAEGTLVEVLGEPVSVDGRPWRQIRSGGREGWVVAVVVRQR